MAENTLEIEGISQQIKKLEKMMASDPRMRENIQYAIRKVLSKVAANLRRDARSGLAMTSDLRKAYKAVRYSVYKRLLGGNVNILQRQRAGAPVTFPKQLKGLPRRGGNRWGRSARTIALESYEGMDRGFILRFLNAGTVDRAIKGYTDKGGDYHYLRSGSVSHIVRNKRGKMSSHYLGGNRGSIAARDWFGRASQDELKGIADNLQNMIDDIIDGLIV